MNLLEFDRGFQKLAAGFRRSAEESALPGLFDRIRNQYDGAAWGRAVERLLDTCRFLPNRAQILEALEEVAPRPTKKPRQVVQEHRSREEIQADIGLGIAALRALRVALEDPDKLTVLVSRAQAAEERDRERRRSTSCGCDDGMVHYTRDDEGRGYAFLGRCARLCDCPGGAPFGLPGIDPNTHAVVFPGQMVRHG